MEEPTLLTKKEIIDDLYSFSKSSYKYDHKSVFISNVTPVDLNCCLRSKFGSPNGIYGSQKKDDINNPLNWQYGFKWKLCHVYIYHNYRDLAFFSVSDEVEKFDQDKFLKKIDEWVAGYKNKIPALKNNLRRYESIRNPYRSFYDLCDSTKDNINHLLKNPVNFPEYPENVSDHQNLQKKLDKVTNYYSALSSHATTLLCFIPVMIESYMHVIFTILAKEAVKNDDRLFDSFLKGGIEIKIKQLPLYCLGFKRQTIDISRKKISKIQEIVGLRNRLLHGNLDLRNAFALEEVYFDNNNIPLFDNNLHAFELMQVYLSKNIEPEYALDLLNEANEFLALLLDNIEDEYRENVEAILKSFSFQYDRKEKILEKKLPDGFKEFVPV